MLHMNANIREIPAHFGPLSLGTVLPHWTDWCNSLGLE